MNRLRRFAAQALSGCSACCLAMFVLLSSGTQEAEGACVFCAGGGCTPTIPPACLGGTCTGYFCSCNCTPDKNNLACDCF